MQVSKKDVIDLQPATESSPCGFCEERPALLNTVHLQTCTDGATEVVFMERICEWCRNAALEDNFPGVVILTF